MPQWVWRLILLVLLVGGFLGGVILLGQLTFEQLRHHERYVLPVTKIECSPPPGMERIEFLEEVQYYARLPVQLHLLEENLPKKLAEALAHHPWVKRVDLVEIIPPRQVRAHLTYRTPILAVRWKDQLRALDAEGILLPLKAPTAHLPVYPKTPSRPTGPAGTVWNDPELLAAVRKAAQRSVRMKEEK